MVDQLVPLTLHIDYFCFFEKTIHWPITIYARDKATNTLNCLEHTNYKVEFFNIATLNYHLQEVNLASGRR